MTLKPQNYIKNDEANIDPLTNFLSYEANSEKVTHNPWPPCGLNSNSVNWNTTDVHLNTEFWFPPSLFFLKTHSEYKLCKYLQIREELFYHGCSNDVETRQEDAIPGNNHEDNNE